MPHFLPIVGEEPSVETVDPRDGSTWRRSGSCNRCGECCRSGDPFNGEEGQGPVEGACPFFSFQLDEKGERLGHCGNREHHYYLGGCMSWPQFPDQVRDYPSCSYRFVKIEAPAGEK